MSQLILMAAIISVVGFAVALAESIRAAERIETVSSHVAGLTMGAGAFLSVIVLIIWAVKWL